MKQGARERLLETADRLFYAEGIHTVGIDRILEESGVAKASLYKNFGSKDALVAAYLDERHERQKARIERAVERAEDPRERILAVFDAQAELFARPDFRGCAFALATAEGRGETVAAERANAYRAYVREVFRDLAAAAGASDAAGIACQLHLLYDGAQTAARMDHDPDIALRAKAAADLLLRAALD